MSYKIIKTVQFFLLTIGMAAAIAFLSVSHSSATTNQGYINTHRLQDPVVMLENTIGKTQRLLKSAKEQKIIKRDPERIIQIIHKNVMPILATRVIAQLLVGAHRWRAASGAVRSRFIALVTRMIAYSYADNIANAGKYKLVIRRFRNKHWRIGSDGKLRRLLVVRGAVVNENGDQSALSINLLRRGMQWRVYDLTVSGVSIMNNFKTQFSDRRQFPNLTTINKVLVKHNDKLKKQFSHR